MPQHLANGFDLMRQMLDAAQPFQAQQFVEPAQQAQPGMFLMQPEVARIGGAAPRQEWLRMKGNRNSAGR